MSLANALFVFGLTLDILGAYYLAQSFITKGLEDLTFEGTAGYGSPPNLRYIRSNLYQKAEAIIGFTLLALGFGLQSFDYFFFSREQSISFLPICVFLYVLVLAVVVILTATFLRRRLFTSYGKRMAYIVIKSSKPEGERNDTWIVTVSEYLLPRLKRAPSEDEHAFANRVLSEVGFSYK